MSIRQSAAARHTEIVRLRHTLHAEPEVGLHLPRTQQKVLRALDGLGLEVATGSELSSVTAVLRGGGPGPAVLLRADMDALPIPENSGVLYSSTVDDTMHACGHDTHTAMLAGAAAVLCERRHELAGDVVFMFQPGEEGCDGASRMLAEGVLEAAGSRPIAAYAMHVAANRIPRGMFTTRPGPLYASSSTLQVRVRGSGGHGSAPHLAADPVPTACEMVTALQTFVTRTFDVFDPVVLTVGSFHAGTQDNIIPDTARFEATVRCFSTNALATMREGAVRVCRGIGAAHGLDVRAEFDEQYPVTVNDAGEAEFLANVVTETMGAQRFTEMPLPQTASEDFSRVLNSVPGAMVMLGACPPERDISTAPDNHSAQAVFDDAVLADGAAVFAELAIRRLAAGQPDGVGS